MRRVLKCILEAHFMRSAVPVLVILSLTQANQKYRKTLKPILFGIIIGPILWKQSSFPTILNQAVGCSQ